MNRKILFICCLLLLVSCGKQKEIRTESSKLKFVERFELKVKEPSGLALSVEGNSLWTVSDNGGRIYKLDFQGNIKQLIDTGIDDLEGIAVVDSSLLAVVSERSGEIILLDTTGHIIYSTVIDSTGYNNSGLEGVTYDTAAGKYFLLKEKDPGIMFTLNDELKIIEEKKLGFA